jgi:hypothetical protein
MIKARSVDKDYRKEELKRGLQTPPIIVHSYIGAKDK